MGGEENTIAPTIFASVVVSTCGTRGVMPATSTTSCKLESICCRNRVCGLKTKLPNCAARWHGCGKR